MSAFGHELRVLLCPQCGAPVEVTSAGGGVATCRFCGAQAQVQVRDDSLDQVLRPQRQPLQENERLVRLRQQTGKPLLPPGNVSHLFDAGAIPPWRLNEALGVFQAARNDSLAAGRPDAGEAVYFLAMALASLFGEQKDPSRQRAVLESALEALRLPRHRQALRCMLARLAAHSGDAAAAAQWLAPCDPASDDLEMDSPYRYTRAAIATMRGDFAEVLQVLGRSPNDIPLLQAAESACVAFRANAVEKLGDVQGASDLLAAHMSNRPDRTALLEKAFDYWAPLELCGASRGAAQAARRQQKAATASSQWGGGTGTVFATLGAAMLLAGAGLLIAALVTAMASPTHRGKGAHAAVVQVPQQGGWTALAAPGGMLFLMGALFVGIGIPVRRAAARARRIALTGEKATARVIGLRPTGMEINRVPQFAVTLMVQRAGGTPPYQATLKTLGMTVRPEASVNVLLDPRDPLQVILDEG